LNIKYQQSPVYALIEELGASILMLLLPWIPDTLLQWIPDILKHLKYI